MNERGRSMQVKYLAGARSWLVAAVVLGVLGAAVTPASGGSYRDSAHGNFLYGVNRSDLDGRYAEYATGNCAHCHEMHASLSGGNPLPAGGPAPHALFAPPFNSLRIRNPYFETDNFCFHCHSDDSGQRVRNQDYSVTFGGAVSGSGPQSILAAFNQESYHNLQDIKVFLDNSPLYSNWFARRNNPCSACHDPHRARRNWDSAQPGFPLVSAVTRPGTTQLWGETEVMADVFGYEAPYAFTESREPAGVGQEDGDRTPDYVTFCSSCHNADNVIWSTTLNRNLRRINWKDTGLDQDKHGKLTRDGEVSLREPYLSASGLKSNFILSCLDCHEAHGSENIMLLRTRINGENLNGIIDSLDVMGPVCARCHQDDQAAGTGESNRWEFVHHDAPGAPYPKNGCIDCHESAAGGTPIACGSCHGHGMDDSWASPRHSGRRTF